MIRKTIPDFPLAMIALLLTAFGIAVVYSAGQTDVPNAAVQAAWMRQLTWLGLGLVAFLVVTRLSVRFLEWAAVPGYLLACGLLVVTLVFGSGAGTAKSMSGWLTIGGIRLGQPSELAKIAVAVMLAKVLASYKVAPRSLLDLLKPGVVVLIPWLLVMLQPDLGTGLVFIGMFFAMLFATVEAANQLQFTQVRDLITTFVRFGADVLLGAAILLIGFWLANLAYAAIIKASGENISTLARIARIAILGLVTAMGLRAMGIADDIVNIAFGLTFGAVAVAIALSFGLGGREAAGRQMEYWLSKLRKGN